MPDAEGQQSPDDVAGLIFGIYSGMTGNELTNTVPIPDDPERTVQALADLQPAGRPFLVRSFAVDRGSGQASNPTAADPVRQARAGRLDSVVRSRSADGGLP